MLQVMHDAQPIADLYPRVYPLRETRHGGMWWCMAISYLSRVATVPDPTYCDPALGGGRQAARSGRGVGAFPCCGRSWLAEPAQARS